MSPSILDPSPPIRFCLNRLRQSVASDARFTDDELLVMVNQGYRSACEQSHCLQNVITITFPAGESEAVLPASHVHTIGVYQAGAKLTPIPYSQSLLAKPETYYQYEGTIGLSRISEAGDQILMLYARSPQPLGFDDVPEWGAEWNYLLRHYAAWQCVLASGGAQTIRKAVGEMAAFQRGVQALHEQSSQSWSYGLSRLRHVSERIAR